MWIVGMRASKGKEKASPRASRSSRKHFMSKFVRESKLGCVRKSSMAEIRADIREIGVRGVYVRALGPQVTGLGSQESLRSGETYFIEADVGESELSVLKEALRKQEMACSSKAASICRLEAQVSTLSAQVSTLTAQLSTQSDRLAALEEAKANVDEDRFSFVGMQICIRAFVDHITSAVYARAGLIGDYTDSEMAEWLRGAEATSFFDCGHSVTLFDVEVELNAPFLSILRSARSVSASISRKHAHSTKPVLVACALSNLLYHEQDPVAKVFKTLFQRSFTEVVNSYEAGTLGIEEAVRLKRKFSSHRP